VAMLLHRRGCSSKHQGKGGKPKYMEDMKKFRNWEEYMSKERMVIDVDEFEKEGWGENAR
jgi:hypothetical protein